MPVKTVLETKIENITILDENGKFDEKLGKDLIPDADVVKLYEHMLVCRRLDEIEQTTAQILADGEKLRSTYEAAVALARTRIAQGSTSDSQEQVHAG